jgi:hypothetical protein
MKQSKVALCLSITALLLSGCATQKDWLATGGSRADGVVSLSYEGNEFQRPKLSQEQADQLATKTCMAWGYKGAESFGSQRTDCLSRRGFGNCGDRRVTVEYQCTGAPGP